jgi:hypothetical protein
MNRPNPIVSPHRGKSRLYLCHPLGTFEEDGEFFYRDRNLARAWEWMIHGESLLLKKCGRVTMFAPWVDLADSDPSGLDDLDRKKTPGNAQLWALNSSSIALSDGVLVVTRPSGGLSNGQFVEIRIARDLDIPIIQMEWGDLP